MKGFLLLFCIGLLGLCGINWLQIGGLKQDIARLETKVQLEHDARAKDSPIGIAQTALDQLQDAVKNTDWKQAQAKLEEARTRIEVAGKDVSDRAKPGVEWMKSQYDELSKQVKDKVGSR